MLEVCAVDGKLRRLGLGERRADFFAHAMHGVPLCGADEDASAGIVQLEAALRVVGHLLPHSHLIVLVAEAVDVVKRVLDRHPPVG